MATNYLSISGPSESSPDVNNNQSYVSFGVSVVIGDNTSYDHYTDRYDVSATLQALDENGNAYTVGTYSSGTNFTWTGAGTYSAISAGAWVGHRSNGDQSVRITASYDYGSSYYGTLTADTGWVSLSNIPRASSISSASAITLGNACSIAWTPKSSSFKYKLSFSLSDWSYTTDYISPSTTNQYTYTGYTVPLTVANQLPNATSGTMSVSLYTYNSGNSSIGSASTSSFTVTIPDSVIPTISTCSMARVTGLNSVIDGWGVYVQGFSKASFAATADGVYSSTISRFQISGGYTASVVGSELSHIMSTPFSTYGTLSFSIVAVDSRGRSSTAYDLGSITVYEYSAPSFTGSSAQRGTTPNTEDAVLQAAWTYSSVNGNNSCTCIFKYKKLTESAYTTYSGSVSNGVQFTLDDILVYNSSYLCKFILTDALGAEVDTVIPVTTTAATVDLKSGGLGVAVGKMSEFNNMFEVAWNAQFNSTVNVKDASSTLRTLLDIIHPIGSVYISALAVSPATIFGGTWQRIWNRFLVGASASCELAVGSILLTGSTITEGSVVEDVTYSEDTVTTADITTTLSCVLEAGSIIKSGSTVKSGSAIEGISYTSDTTTSSDITVYQYLSGAIGGEAAHTLTTDEMPRHTHASNRTIGQITNTAAFTYNDGTCDVFAAADDAQSSFYVAWNGNIVANTGGGQSHNNLPPYYAVYMWVRTA